MCAFSKKWIFDRQVTDSLMTAATEVSTPFLFAPCVCLMTVISSTTAFFFVANNKKHQRYFLYANLFSAEMTKNETKTNNKVLRERKRNILHTTFNRTGVIKTNSQIVGERDACN